MRTLTVLVFLALATAAWGQGTLQFSGYDSSGRPVKVTVELGSNPVPSGPFHLEGGPPAGPVRSGPVQPPAMPIPPRPPKAGVEDDADRPETRKQPPVHLPRDGRMVCMTDYKAAVARAERERRNLVMWVGMDCSGHEDTRAALDKAAVHVHVPRVKGVRPRSVVVADRDGDAWQIPEKLVSPQLVMDTWDARNPDCPNGMCPVQPAERPTVLQAPARVTITPIERPAPYTTEPPPGWTPPPTVMRASSGCTGGMAGAVYSMPMMEPAPGGYPYQNQSVNQSVNVYTGQPTAAPAMQPMYMAPRSVVYTPTYEVPVRSGLYYQGPLPEPVRGMVMHGMTYSPAAAPVGSYGAPLGYGLYNTPSGKAAAPGFFSVPGARFPADGPIRRMIRRGLFDYDQ